MRRAFTLIEILIVVVILGILAAMVIPQFVDASGNANDASLRTTIQTVRSQVELYKVQHNDTYSDLATNGWTDLISGDYLQAAPKNPMLAAGSNTTVAAAVTSGAAWGWASGELVANDGANGVFVE
jgi:general secretion pathway protein G